MVAEHGLLDRMYGDGKRRVADPQGRIFNFFCGLMGVGWFTAGFFQTFNCYQLAGFRLMLFRVTFRFYNNPLICV